jgi:hypothetical protein
MADTRVLACGCHTRRRGCNCKHSAQNALPITYLQVRIATCPLCCVVHGRARCSMCFVLQNLDAAQSISYAPRMAVSPCCCTLSMQAQEAKSARQTKPRTNMALQTCSPHQNQRERCVLLVRKTIRRAAAKHTKDARCSCQLHNVSK